MITIPYPTKKRAIRALLLAPMLPVGIVFLLDAVDRVAEFGALYVVGAAMLAFYILAFVELVTILFGGLALAVLWRRIPFNLFICVFIGGLVAALPFLIYGLIPSFQTPIDYDAWGNGQQTVVHGVKTAYGRWQDVISIVEIFVLGTIGGGFFWWLCRPKLPQESQDA